jgi:hypothetical protein
LSAYSQLRFETLEALVDPLKALVQLVEALHDPIESLVCGGLLGVQLALIALTSAETVLMSAAISAREWLDEYSMMAKIPPTTATPLKTRPAAFRA